ncbi:MAG: excinuclease ABC subunit UvrC [Sediminibacterium sp.]|jgi:excinuclease ABC subunit C|nr:excinuclease ABC subunit UvrC [Sediminibacterium sp.]
MEREIFKKIQASLPQEPGIYQYFDEKGKLLYVGKAKNIRNRVSSYFNANQHSLKTIELVQKIQDIQFTIVNSEHDAFILENELIKNYQPKYNINLKDDKTYPYIVIKNEHFPRVFLTRRKIKDGSTYYGPYTHVFAVRELIKHIKESIALRTCTLPLSPNNIEKGKFKVCLEYHLGNCKGPCQGLQTEEDYEKSLEQVTHLLKGNVKPLIAHLNKEMNEQASALAFEKAALTKKKIEELEQYQTKSVVYIKQQHAMDVFSIAHFEDQAYVNYLMVQDGRIVQTHMLPLSIPLEESKETVLAFAIHYFRSNLGSTANEIIVPFEPEDIIPSIKYTIPKVGEKEQLLALSQKNSDYALKEWKHKQALLLVTDTSPNSVLEEMKEVLHLGQVPTHIECFDNSNFQGAYPVSAMVCFKNGVPSKSDYRKFNIKTVVGINDFASMKESVYRRYHSVITKNEALPQLVIIDGGKGQLNAALEALTELGIQDKVTIVGLAKNIEELFFVGDSNSILLNWNSEAHKLIRNIRDEVHRFGIQFHRNKRSKGALETGLDHIEGIGPKTKEILLQYFKSANKVKKASPALLKEIIGAQKTKILLEAFAKEEN